MNSLIGRFAASALALALMAGCGSPDAIVKVRRSCALLASCPSLSLPMGRNAQNGGSCFAAGAQESLGTVTPETAYELDCGRTSNTCQAYRDCISRDHGPTYCAAHPGDSCDGNVRVTCPRSGGGNPAILDPAAIVPTEDCALAMGECHEMGGNAACTTSTPCDSTMTQLLQPHCQGDHIELCNTQVQRIVVAQDCAAAGGTCAMGSSMFAPPQCVPSGPACTVPAGMDQADTAHCEDNHTVATCITDNSVPRNPDGSAPGHISRVTCNSDVLEAHCGTVHGLGACIPNSNACAADSPDRCDGDTLMICVNGHYEGTPCSSIGLQHCTQLTYLIAACTNNAP